jgi:hypothetical protein
MNDRLIGIVFIHYFPTKGVRIKYDGYKMPVTKRRNVSFPVILIISGYMRLLLCKVISPMMIPNA